MTLTCKNCNTSFDGRFCPMCSQRADTHRLSLGHFAHELLHAITHTDKGILFLIKELSFRPGHVVREYIEGKRKKYFNPFSFLLIMLALQILAYNKTDLLSALTDKSAEMIRSMGSSIKYEDVAKEMDQARIKSEKAVEYNKALNLILLPILALMTWLLFRKSKFNYTENLIFHFFIMGQVLVFFLVFCVLPFLIFPDQVIVIYYLYFLLLLGYNLFSFRQFFQDTWTKTILKSVLLFAIYFTAIQQITNLALKYL
jgi:hypothetical protein